MASNKFGQVIHVAGVLISKMDGSQNDILVTVTHLFITIFAELDSCIGNLGNSELCHYRRLCYVMIYNSKPEMPPVL